MTTISTQELISNAKSNARAILAECMRLKSYPETLLEQKPADGGWSVAQVLDHLNFYSRYYHVIINKKICSSKHGSTSKFKPGLIGNYFTKLMQPGPGGTVSKKIKAMKTAMPATIVSSAAALDECIQHQYELLRLLELSQQHDLNNIRIPSSLSNMIRLKLGDTFNFILAHEQRHFAQINRIMARENSLQEA